MSAHSRKNTLIGVFVLGAMALAMALAAVALGGGWGREAFQVVMVFDSSVKGLSVGAPVAFRGVQIGQVTDIELIFNSDNAGIITKVNASIKSDNITREGVAKHDLLSEMMERGLRAQLNTISLLTGLLYIQLDFKPDSQLALADIDSPYVQIPTLETDFERITREIEKVDFTRIASDLQGTLAGLNQFVNNADLQDIATDLRQTLAGLNATMRQLEQQINAIGPDVRKVLANADNTIDAVNTQIPQLSNSAQSTLDEMQAVVKTLRDTIAALQYSVSDDSPTLYQFNQAMTEVAKAGRAIQALADTLEQQPEALLRGKQETP
ncbi:MAG: paraquat-inducible protein B [Gammaproteobacteria bacterium]|nr:MAG: paraquat-inducible protein B [Gammaproteobacteria bacterium]